MTTKGNSRPELVWLVWKKPILSKGTDVIDRNDDFSLKMTCALQQYICVYFCSRQNNKLQDSLCPQQVFLFSFYFTFIARLNFLRCYYYYYYCWHRIHNYEHFSWTCAYVSGLLSSIQFLRTSSLQISWICLKYKLHAVRHPTICHLFFTINQPNNYFTKWNEFDCSLNCRKNGVASVLCIR